MSIITKINDAIDFVAYAVADAYENWVASRRGAGPSGLYNPEKPGTEAWFDYQKLIDAEYNRQKAERVRNRAEADALAWAEEHGDDSGWVTKNTEGLR